LAFFQEVWYILVRLKVSFGELKMEHNETPNVQAVIMAAGRSTRFKRKECKLLSKICGQPMVIFPIKLLRALKIPSIAVLGYQAEEVKNTILSVTPDVEFAIQKEPLGTGDAVISARHLFKKDHILIMNGDVPLLSKELLTDLISQHSASQADLSFVSTDVINPTGYGRVVENEGKFLIREEKNCSEKEKDISKINAGIYLVKRPVLETFLKSMTKNPLSGEFYLTDIVAFASKNDFIVKSIFSPFDQVRGVNTLQELWAVEQITRSALIKKFMANGVRFELAQSTHLDLNVEIGSDSFIGTGAHILGTTKIGEGCFISAFTIIENSIIGDCTTIHSHSVIQDSNIGKDAHIGPFARLRSNVTIGDNSRIGNFVEVKGSLVGNKTKIKHLAYIGDTTVGNEVNVGAGTIICNYDGYKKNKTIIEDNVFVGSNNTIIAPVKIGKGAYLAAGSTINKDVPSHALAIARSRQENKENYVEKLKAKRNNSSKMDAFTTKNIISSKKVSSV
jgi:bifunctional UDP-N-acetylglucosamine pyrophosphorylase / glucosamine-1-phosphate N-acetyltransferase